MNENDLLCVDFILTDLPYFVRYRDRTGRAIANDDDGWVMPAFRAIIACCATTRSVSVSMAGPAPTPSQRQRARPGSACVGTSCSASATPRALGFCATNTSRRSCSPGATRRCLNRRRPT